MEEEDEIPSFSVLDYKHQILDEICLEGLDGITLQALWLRLQARPGCWLGRDYESRRFTWQVIQTLQEVEVMELSKPRSNLIIHDRYKYMDGELGIVVEPEYLPEDLYPFSLVEDTDLNIRGSCLTYFSRSRIDKKLRFDEAERMGGKLVLVGNQEQRTRSILENQLDPLQVQSITAMQWALLERIGRARFQGEITQGNLSLQFTNENPKTLFYHRKALLSKGLLRKQVHHQKTTKQMKNMKSRSQNSQGTLFHLPRFYVERQPKTLMLVKNVVEFLIEQPTKMATYEDLKVFLNIGNSFKKLFKTQEFQRFVRGDVKVPYRAVHPEATDSEWRRKGMSEEKNIRVVQLLNPDIRPEDVTNQTIQLLNQDIRPEHVTNQTQHMNQGVLNQENPTPGILDQSSWILDRSMMWQAYRFVEGEGPEGISQQELGRRLGHGKLEARTICRNLLRRSLVITVLNDQGRQRVTNFVAKKFEHLSPSSNQFLLEKKKNEALLLSSAPNLDLEDEYKDEERVSEYSILYKRKRGAEDEEDEKKIKKKPALYQGEDEDDIAEEEDEAVLVEDEEQDHENGEDMLKVEEEVEEMKVDEEEEKVDSWINCSESNSCDSIISMSIRSDFQLDDKCKSPVKGRREKKGESQATFRQLRRTNTIIEAVRLHKVIDDPTKLYKMIQENEAREGYGARMDKKSLMRILTKLGNDNHIKNITVELKLQDKIKSLHFVCEPGIDKSNTVIQSAIEQAKMKFNSFRGSPEPELRFTDEDGRVWRDETSSPPSTPVPGSPTKLRASRRYGLQPKFVRMRELHILLFYLRRNYTGILDLDPEIVFNDLVEKGLVRDIEKKEFKNFKVYSKEVSWKMFIPPLPLHSGWDEGWVLITDVLLRLPLSVFVKLVHVTLEIPGLQDFLEHPVKQHLLIRSLPHYIREQLLHQRKYIFTVHEVSTRLAYIGAVQFGPQKLKEKDQVFIYINQNTSLTDTTSSIPGYHQICREGVYPRKDYKLKCLVDVEHYWYDMWEICLNTPLGESSMLSGQEITLEVMDRKPEMVVALSPRLASEAPVQDLGHVPGDGLGAAGLDSSIFAHLKRNWSWNAGLKRGEKVEKLTKPPFCISLLQDERSNSLDLGEATEGSSIRVTTAANRAKDNKRKKSGDAETPAPKKVIVKEGTGRTIKYVRVVGKRKTNVERKPYYDEKDKAALRLMRKLRVDWSPREDSFLLLCKVAGTYLCSNTRAQMVQYTSVRDLLHTYFPESSNKTSRACQRRLNYMMKNGTTADNVALFLADVQQDEELVSKFPLAAQGSETRLVTETRLEKEFSELVDLLIAKHRDNPNGEAELNLPDSMEDILKQYRITYPSDSSINKLGFTEPKEVSDIHESVLNTLVTSSLCTASDRRSWTFQLFKIYQQYPDSLLRKVMANLRENKMVSLKKQYNKNKVKQGNYLPLSSSPYQLSVTFSHTFLNRYQYDIYSQSWQMLKVFLRNPDQYTDIHIGQEGGFAAAVVSLLAREQLLFRTEVPEQLVVLDPGLSAVDENYVRILQRYKELLRNAGGIDPSDVDYAKSPTKLTSTSLFTKRGAERNSKDEEEAEQKKKGEDNDKDDDDNVVRTEDACAEEKPGADLQNQIVFQEGSDTRSNTALAKSASRIALYMMREEMRESPLDSGDPIQHSHDFFVISSCSIAGKLLGQGQVEEQRLVKYSGIEIPVNRLPGDVNAYERILKRFGLNLHGNSVHTGSLADKAAYVPLENNIEDFHEDLLEIHDVDLDNLEAFMNLIDEKKDLGITKQELRESNLLDKDKIKKLLQFTLEKCLVLDVGIVKTRFVSHKFCKSWLIHSYKLNRVRDLEKMQKVQFAGKLYQGHGPIDKEEEKEPEPEPEGTDGRRTSRRISRKKSLDAAVGGEDISVDHRARNPQYAARLSREVSDAVQKINWDEMEEVLVRIRPWIRVDGTLNRRVLDRLLGAVLGGVMQQPGSLLSNLTSRFSPALQPTHSRELLFMLQEIQAVSILKLVKQSTIGLWSKPGKVSLKPADILDLDTELIVEPSVDSILKLGQFIGDKLYSQDFVCQCPCHPERRM